MSELKALFLGGMLPCMAFACFILVVSAIKKERRHRRMERRKKELMEWLFFIGIQMDKGWTNPKGYSKDATKEWLAKMTTLHFNEVRRKEHEKD